MMFGDGNRVGAVLALIALGLGQAGLRVEATTNSL